MKNKITQVVGVDEAGRGSLAGPVAVAAVVVPKHFSWKRIPGVTDSKILSKSKRDMIFQAAQKLRESKEVEFAVALVGPSVIDKIGIVRAVTLGTSRCLRSLKLEPAYTNILLDGLLSAPQRFQNQKTIVRGDCKEKVIGLASIVAKVTRDAYMEGIAAGYPRYKFFSHKGYGTNNHRRLIKKHGASEVHRKTFCKNLLV